LLHPLLRPPRYAAIDSDFPAFGNHQCEPAFTPSGIRRAHCKNFDDSSL
jgi:hypothetical protein